MVSDKNQQNAGIPEAPNFAEAHWYAASVAMVIVSLVVGAFAAGWVLIATDTDEMKLRTELISPFGACFLALTTFCTVAWRGMVTSRQADQQRLQNVANDAANYAKLLQEGAKLLSDEDKPQQVMAGIASLSIVITEPERRFAHEAIDLIADYVQDNYSGTLNSRLGAAIRVMSDAAGNGIRSRVDGKLVAKGNRRWVAVKGFKSVTYVGGIIRKAAHTALHKDSGNVWLDNVTIEQANIFNTISYTNCILDRCRIYEITSDDFETNGFYGCNFSGAEFVQPEKPTTIRDLAAHKNYFIGDNSPDGADADQWKVMLNWYVSRADALEDLKDFNYRHFTGDT
ncbi:hypothetical protein ACU8OH_09545 [Rhizobium leguminosarum]